MLFKVMLKVDIKILINGQVLDDISLSIRLMDGMFWLWIQKRPLSKKETFDVAPFLKFCDTPKQKLLKNFFSFLNE